MYEKMAKDYIIEALLLLMKKKRYTDIKITDIANKAGVNRVTFYRNFSSKEEVIKVYLECAFNDWGKRWEESGDTNVSYQIFKFFDEQREVIDLLYKSNLQFILAEKILSASSYNEYDPNIIAYTKSMFAYAIFGWCNEWYKRGMKENPEEILNLFENLQKTTNQ